MTATVVTQRSNEPGAAPAGGIDVSLIAHLAFARADNVSVAAEGRHLALLPTESLELDLTDPAQRQFGDYELLELIGEGGMGVVYRARQSSLDREVAIKLLAAGVWASGEFVERFRREAQNAARMQHPNIVPVYEVGNNDELHFFSMRLIRGPSLAAELKRETRIAPQRAAQLLRTVAEAVDYAHRLGVLHLDLKPANVLVDENGVPHVADFGLARRLDSALAAESDEVSGTPSYMAPEQASPRIARISRATDIWGLGAILYELVTGEPPFLAASPQETLQLVVGGALRSPRRFAADLPRDLEAVILKCMAYRVDERYASARELADDLSRFLEGRAVQARPLNPPQRLWRWARREPKLAATAMFAFVALAAGLVATTQQWRRADVNARRAEANASAARDHLWESRDQAILRLMESGDGWDAAPLLLTSITEMEAAGAVERSAAARRKLGIIERSNPQLIDAVGVDGAVTALAFDQDGTRLAVSTDMAPVQLYRVADGTMTPFRIDASQPPWVFMGLARVAFAADGRRVLGETISGARMIPRIVAGDQSGDVASGAWNTVASQLGAAEGVEGSMSDDGQYAVLTDVHAMTHLAAVDTRQPIAAPRRVAVNPGLPFVLPLFAPDDRWLAVTHHGELEFVDVATGRETRVALPADFEIVDAWQISPDSRWLVVSDHDGHALAIEHATGAVRPLDPQPPYPVTWFAFSPDGTRLAAASGKGGVYLWQWPQGKLLVPPFGGPDSVDHVAFDERGERVLVNGNDLTAAIWQVMPARYDIDRQAAVQIGDRLAIQTLRAGDRVAPAIAPVDWNAARGLLADSRALLRISRLPPPVLKQSRAAPLKPSVLQFDGRRLAAVDGHSVRVVDALRETVLAGPIELPQAASFAQVVGDGSTLVVVSGRELRVFDAASGAPRFAPVALANSPVHVEPSPDGKAVLTSWFDSGPEGTGEQLELWDLADGHRIAGPRRVPGPLDEILYSNSGQRLLVWSPEYVSVLDRATLSPLPGPLADRRAGGFRKVREAGAFLAAAFDGDNPLLAEAFGDTDGSDGAGKATRLAKAELQRYGADGNRRIEPASPNWKTMRVLPGGHEVLVLAGDDPLDVRGPGGAAREFDDAADPSALRGEALAATRDGRWIARSLADGVELFDARDGRRVGRWHAPLPRPDRVWQIAFSPDGERLLASTLRNRWLVFELGPDKRPVAQIRRELDLRGIGFREGSTRQPVATPDAAERAALRAGDPGPPPPAPAATPSEIARRLAAGGTIPARAAATPPECLDLTAIYNRALDEMPPTMSAPSDYAWLPPGTQRLMGVDFDVRGAIQLRDDAGFVEQAQHDAPTRVDVPAGGRAAAVIDLLMVANYPGGPDTIATTVTLHYADGSSGDLPVRYERDVVHWRRQTELRDSLRLATLGYDARMVPEFPRRVRAYAVRLANPKPGQPIDHLTLTAGKEHGAAPVILAITLQADASAPPVGTGTSP